MPQLTNPDWIDWKKRKVKKLILKYLEEGVLGAGTLRQQKEEN